MGFFSAQYWSLLAATYVSGAYYIEFLSINELVIRETTILEFFQSVLIRLLFSQLFSLVESNHLGQCDHNKPVVDFYSDFINGLLCQWRLFRDFESSLCIIDTHIRLPVYNINIVLLFWWLQYFIGISIIFLVIKCF